MSTRQFIKDICMVFSEAVFSWFQNRDAAIDIINEPLHVDAIETYM